MKLLLNDITILPDRHRQYFSDDDIADLAESMRLVGQIQPIVVDEQNILIVGETRLKAARLLGWKEIEVVKKSDIDELTYELMQLEENLRRRGLTYVEDLFAKLRFHEIFQEQKGKTSQVGGRKGGWKVEDTAKHLGISTGAMSQDLQLAKAMKNDEELQQQQSKIQAWHMYQRKQQIKARQLLAIIDSKKGEQENESRREDENTKHNNENVESVSEISPSFTRLGGRIKLFNTDSRRVLKRNKGTKYHCLITDPEWGVGFDKEFGNQFDALNVTREVLKLAYDQLEPGSLCWMFCATKHLISGKIYKLILDCGYRLFDQILLWCKPTVAHSSHPFGEIKNDYEPVMFFSKGDPRPLTKPIFAVQIFKLKGRKFHPSQKPVPLIEKIIECSTVENEHILDPFAGSGSVLKAAIRTNRRATGIEISHEWYSDIVFELKKGEQDDQNQET